MPTCDLCGCWTRETAAYDGLEVCVECARVDQKPETALAALGPDGEPIMCSVCDRAIARHAVDMVRAPHDGVGVDRPVHTRCHPDPDPVMAESPVDRRGDVDAGV